MDVPLRETELPHECLKISPNGTASIGIGGCMYNGLCYASPQAVIFGPTKPRSTV